MQLKTSSLEFERYGSVYDKPVSPGNSGMISRDLHLIAKRSLNQVYHFDCEVCLELQSGMATLVVGESLDTAKLEEFAVHRNVRLKPGLYWNLIAVTSNITCKMIATTDYSYSLETLPASYMFRRILPRVRISEILGYYYNIRNSGYTFKGETHGYFELTYVDRGELMTEIDGKEYTIREKELMIYGPGQFHNQNIAEGHSCSYVTIIFDMETIVYDVESTHYELLLNKVFSYDKKIYTLIKTFVAESTSEIPYMNSLMLCLLTETIIRLLQGTYASPMAPASSTAHQSTMDELFDRIIAYIDDNIYDPLTIPEICEHFSLSRSALQLLFKNSVDQSPKKYINDKKLERSCQMLLENRYTISEISLRLGYSSIHYFSKSFNMKYHMSPSEFVKQNCQSSV